MIKEFIKRYNDNKASLEDHIRSTRPESYKDVVEAVCKVIGSGEDFTLDHNNIREIDDGHYQGTLIYVIPEQGYQPSTYYYLTMGYGSCSFCDLLQNIQDEPEEKQIKSFMSLTLHIVQSLKKME